LRAGSRRSSLPTGPVITGTALRSVAPFHDFGDFRDQIEFALLVGNDKTQAWPRARIALQKEQTAR
jgi:predicted lipoprotein